MEWDEIQRAMVVFAHPDDAEFGNAGTVARLTGEGKEVTYVVVTDGSKGSSDPNMSREELAELRKREQCGAAEVLNLSHVEFLGFEDGMLEPTIEVRKTISGAIRKYKPDVVICQMPVRDITVSAFAQHPDHIAAGEATMASVYPAARDPLTFPELLEAGLEPHKVREVWITGVPNPDFFVDITETLDKKIQALKAHESQVGHRDVAEFIPQRARQVAEMNNQDFEYAESYKRIVMP